MAPVVIPALAPALDKSVRRQISLSSQSSALLFEQNSRSEEQQGACVCHLQEEF